jgi:chaperonin GroES
LDESDLGKALSLDAKPYTLNAFSNMAKKEDSKKPVAKATESKLKIRPLGDRVLVKPLGADEAGMKTASGIIIPDTVSKEKPERGTVVAVGEGRFEDGTLVPMRVKVGDEVVFSKYGFDEIKIDEVEYFILKEDSILAIIK